MYITSNVASHARNKRYNYYACFVFGLLDLL